MLDLYSTFNEIVARLKKDGGWTRMDNINSFFIAPQKVPKIESVAGYLHEISRMVNRIGENTTTAKEALETVAIARTVYICNSKAKEFLMDKNPRTLAELRTHLTTWADLHGGVDCGMS